MSRAQKLEARARRLYDRWRAIGSRASREKYLAAVEEWQSELKRPPPPPRPTPEQRRIEAARKKLAKRGIIV